MAANYHARVLHNIEALVDNFATLVQSARIADDDAAGLQVLLQSLWGRRSSPSMPLTADTSWHCAAGEEGAQ